MCTNKERGFVQKPQSLQGVTAKPNKNTMVSTNWFHLWTSPLICFRNQRFTFRNCAVDMLMWFYICFLLCVLRILQIRGTCTEMQNFFDEVILLAEKWGHLGKGLSMRRFLSYKCIVQHFRHDLCKKWFSYSMFCLVFQSKYLNILKSIILLEKEIMLGILEN